ncbi:hypothetical protein BH10ACI1_BH10ACI1_34310 [soil metagenome]
MINEMNYRFPILALGFMGFFAGKCEDTKTAKSIAVEAKKIAAKATQENKHGETTKAILRDATNEKQKEAFTAIAVWHYERAAQKYRLAAEKLDSLSRLDLSERNANYLESKRNQFAKFSVEIKRKAEQIEHENQILSKQ